MPTPSTGPRTSTPASASASMPDLRDYVTTNQAAEDLGVVRSRVLSFIYDGRTDTSPGRLPAEKVGDQWMIKKSDLDLVRNRKPGRPGWACNRTTTAGKEKPRVGRKNK